MLPPETPRHSWASLGQFLMGSLFLSPGSWCTQGFVCAHQESVSPVLGSSGSSMVWLMVTSSKRAYAIPRSAAPSVPIPVAGHYWPIPSQETLKHSKADLAQSVWGLLVCVFEPSSYLWWVWSLILNAILPLQPSFWDFSFDLGGTISFFGTIQHSLVDGCSAASCKFGVFAGEDEHMSFYSTIFQPQSCLQTASDWIVL